MDPQWGSSRKQSWDSVIACPVKLTGSLIILETSLWGCHENFLDLLGHLRWEDQPSAWTVPFYGLLSPAAQKGESELKSSGMHHSLLPDWMQWGQLHPVLTVQAALPKRTLHRKHLAHSTMQQIGFIITHLGGSFLLKMGGSWVEDCLSKTLIFPPIDSYPSSLIVFPLVTQGK